MIFQPSETLNNQLTHIIIGFCLTVLLSCSKTQKTATSSVNPQQNKAANDLFFKGIQYKNQQKWKQSAEAFESFLQLDP